MRRAEGGKGRRGEEVIATDITPKSVNAARSFLASIFQTRLIIREVFEISSSTT